MAALLLRPETLPQLRERLDELEPDTRPLWGKRDPASMLAHLTRNVEVALGEVAVKDLSNLFSRTGLRWYVFYSGIPWPKGKIQAPAVLSPPPEGEVDAERERLIAAMERFVAALAEDPKRRAVHPFFGPVSLKGWRRMLGIHIDYHLVQFGV